MGRLQCNGAGISGYLARLAEKTSSEMGLPGLAIAVTNRDEVLHSVAHGVSDIASGTGVSESTRFEIGSLGKPFTVIPLMQLYEQGIVDLHSPVSRYLPWFRINSPFPEITVHHLLNHTSGLPRGTDIAPHGLYESWALRDFRPVSAPGEYFWYSNIGYKTLGFLLEKVTGQSLPEIISERVLGPLGMNNTSPAVDSPLRENTATGYASIYDDRPERRNHPLAAVPWAPYATGDGAQVSNIADMSAYLRLLLNRGQGPRGRLLSEESLDLMIYNGVWTGGDYYGYGLATYPVEGRVYIGHGGGNAGFRSAMVIDMEHGLGVVLLTNRMGETDPLVEVAQQALTAACADAAGHPLPSLSQLPDPRRIEDAADLAGEYQSASRKFTLTAVGDGLMLQYGGGQAAVEVERRTGDTFYVPHPDFDLALLEFSRTDGQVTELFHGPDWYVRQGVGGRSRRSPAFAGMMVPAHPAEWEAFTGHFRARNPELSNFRVVIRKGTLTLLNPWGDTVPLTPLGDAHFRIGLDPRGPETLTFSAITDNRALRVDYTGCPYFRTFEE